jgi:hypothetical protein
LLGGLKYVGQVNCDRGADEDIGPAAAIARRSAAVDQTLVVLPDRAGRTAKWRFAVLGRTPTCGRHGDGTAGGDERREEFGRPYESRPPPAGRSVADGSGRAKSVGGRRAGDGDPVVLAGARDGSGARVSG